MGGGHFYRGRHRKPTDTGRHLVAGAAAGAVTLGGLGGLTAPEAQAAPPGGWGAIIDCESGGDPTAQNASSSASGLFQFIDSTWRSVGGTGSAKDASVAEQYRRAEILYDRAGTTPWNASRSCWAGRSVPEPARVAPAAAAASTANARTVQAHPLPGGRATSGFGAGRNHQGYDLAAATGTPVRAALSGTVVKAGWGSGYGNVVYLRHDGGIETRYAHLSSIGVSVGERVSAGDTIGRVGSTGDSTGPHLHFEVRVGGSAVNPASWLSGASAPVPQAPRQRQEAPRQETPRQESAPRATGERAADGTGTYVCAPNKLGFEACDEANLGEVVDYPSYTGKHRVKASAESAPAAQAARTHVVTCGDWLSTIASRYDVTWQDLYAANRDVIGDDPHFIVAGMRLTVP